MLPSTRPQFACCRPAPSSHVFHLAGPAISHFAQPRRTALGPQQQHGRSAVPAVRCNASRSQSRDSAATPSDPARAQQEEQPCSHTKPEALELQVSPSSPAAAPSTPASVLQRVRQQLSHSRVLLSVSAVSATAALGTVGAGSVDFSGPASTLAALAVMAAIVAVHETGHFMAARLQGIRVSQFSIGFGPPLWTYTGPEGIEYSLRAIPLGGYVAFPEDEEERESAAAAARPPGSKPRKPAAAVKSSSTSSKKAAASKKWDPNDPDLLQNRPIIQRAIVISAGVIANVIFAYAVLLAQVVSVGQASSSLLPGVNVPVVSEGSPAQVAGLRSGDILLEVGGLTIPASQTQVRGVVQAIGASGGKPLTLLVDRRGEKFELSVLCETGADGRGRMGAQLSSHLLIKHTYPDSVGKAITMSSSEFVRLFSTVAGGVASIFTNFSNVSAQLNGPVAIVVTGSKIARTDSSGLFQFCALVNINLAIVNVLPLPALDGGYLALLLLEALRGKKLPVEVEQTVSAGGLLLLLALGVSLVVKDTINLF